MAFDAVLNLADLDGRNGFVINGVDAWDISGESVSNAGDINGDGIDDLIIGASLVDFNETENVGASYVVFGGSNLGGRGSLDLETWIGGNGFVINGIAEGDTFGDAVSGVGDLNGDGFDDLIIGAPVAYDRLGESYVVFGGGDIGDGGNLNLAALDGKNGFVLNGVSAGDNSGWSVSNAGDVNGDSFDDLIIGALGADAGGVLGAGASYVVFGGRDVGSSSSLDLTALDGSNGFVIQGENTFDRLGWSVSNAGDVNGDGFDDLVVGAPNADPGSVNGAGASYIVFGGGSVGSGGSLDVTSLNGSNGFVITGLNEFDLLGDAVSGAGDINNDGIDDFIIGAPFADSKGLNAAGVSYVVFGSSNVGSSGSLDVTALDGNSGFVINGLNELDYLGRSVSQTGDVNGDGIDDLIIGATLGDSLFATSGEGKSYVIFGDSDVGSSGSLDLATLDGRNGLVINGIDANDFSGFSVSGGGDINGDGLDDLIIGAPGADPNGNESAGESYVVFGSNPFNNEPTAINDAFIVNEDQILSGNVFSANGNDVDSDVDGDSLRVIEVNRVAANVGSSIALPSGAILTLNTYGTFDYDPNGQFATLDPGESALDLFIYTISDGNGGTATATVEIVVTGINEAPTLEANVFSVFQGSTVAVGVDDLWAIDPDNTDTELSFTASAVIGGQFQLNGEATNIFTQQDVLDGFVTFAHDGSDVIPSYNIIVSDGIKATDPVTVAIDEFITLNEIGGGFFDFEAFLRFQDPDASIPDDEVGGLELAQLFDEGFYLSQNPDVAQAVNEGSVESGFEHFASFGIREGRNPSVLYDEAFYLNANPDVAQAVSARSFASGLEHFLLFGHWEKRDPSNVFSQTDYLASNPDVLGVLNDGLLGSGFEHYIEFGVEENRLPLSLYSEGFYLLSNPDVQAAVSAGNFASGLEHFVQFGQREGRAPSHIYDEASYLALNSDVAAAVANGDFISGFDHYQQFGRFEGRQVLA